MYLLAIIQALFPMVPNYRIYIQLWQQKEKQITTNIATLPKCRKDMSKNSKIEIERRSNPCKKATLAYYNTLKFPTAPRMEIQSKLSVQADFSYSNELALKRRAYIIFAIYFCLMLTLFIVLLFVVGSGSGPTFHTVAIIGTNDLHGGAFPTSLFRSDTGEGYTYGGLEYMAQMIETVQNEYPGNVLYLDAGDQFQGGIQASSLVSSGQIMNDFYNTMGLAGSAIGNHQFDFGPTFLNNYWSGRSAESPNLAANLRSQTGVENFLSLQKGQQLYTLTSGIKIGVIGLATIETPSTTASFNDGSFPAYQFLNYSSVVIERSKRLRDAGADAVILVGHVGNDCNATSKFGIWRESTVQDSTCSGTDEVSKLIKSLPAGTVDGVVQGHRHRFSHTFIEGVPVMGTVNGGFYFNILYLKFQDKKIYQKIIEGPVPVCERIFSNLGTCGYFSRTVLATAGNLIPWKFHGRTVKKQTAVQNLFTTKWLPQMGSYLTPLVNNQVVMTKIYTYENDLGNLATNLMHAVVPQADIVILNAGGFRTTWVPGVIQYQHFYNMFPFVNTVNSVEMTGQELLDTLVVIQSGTKAFYPTYGLSQFVNITSTGEKKFINATLYNGTAIVPTQNYRVASIQFLTLGGDDFKNVINKVYTVRNEITYGDFKTLIQPELVKLGTIRENTLVDPAHPRLTIIKV